jgi:hypothetical protein
VYRRKSLTDLLTSWHGSARFAGGHRKGLLTFCIRIRYVRSSEISDKCLIKNRDLRYQTAAEIHSDLLQLKKDFDSGKKLKTTGPTGPIGESGRITLRRRDAKNRIRAPKGRG